MKHRYAPYLQFCSQLRQQHLMRTLPPVLTFTYDFSSNDYLGLSRHPKLINAAVQAALGCGVGSGASRLITTQQNDLRELEKSIAKAKQKPAALIFATGFQANLSALSALLDPKILGTMPLIFADRLNHASFHVACNQVKVKQFRFHHLDYDHLKWGLQKSKDSKQPKFILTESVFGMDGDIACLDTLIRLAKDDGAFLYVDEAHATGLYGHQGYGLTSQYGKEIDVSMGTFSKALGSTGAYIACSHTLKRYFLNRCAGLIYSTAPSPMQVAAMQAAWDLIPSMQPKVNELLHNAKRVRERLQALGFDTGQSTTHIIPIILKIASKTLDAQRFLSKRDVRVSAIRPPSVGPQLSRLRIALNTTHDEKALEALVSGLQVYNQEKVYS